MNFIVDPSILNWRLTVEGEMAYSPINDFDIQQGFRESQPQMRRLDLRGEWL